MAQRPGYKSALGLKYDSRREPTPSLSVKGEDLDADQVVKIARRYGIPVVHDPDLARALSTMELDQQIPADLFEAVAIVLNHLN